jgi:dihydropteroate synthase
MNQDIQVWGILNVTPDSFSDGGKFLLVDEAVKQAELMISQGATLIDVGGESTRPGAERISAAEEISRISDVVEALVEKKIPVSLDTMKAEVAKFGINTGVKIVNDVSGGKADSEMFKQIANSDVEYVMMHWRGHSDVMNSLTKYDNVVSDVISEWSSQKNLALEAGIANEKIIFDPGLGFAKDADHNWNLLAHLPQLNDLGHRVLIGASRKRFLAPVSPFENVESRDIPTAQISAWCAQHDIYAVRVHDIPTTVSAIATAVEVENHVI